MEKKITKKEYYAMLKDIVQNVELEDETLGVELVNFLDKQINMIDAKAEKAKEKAAEKRAEADELKNTIKSLLTDELQTVDAILGKIEGEDLTKAKIVARLSSLCREGIAEKLDTKSEDGRKVKGYRLMA